MTQHDKPTTPTVSIGMPVYNGQKYIREALDSLLAQTFTDFELIISDNASTDGTEAICREYAARDSRIRYVRQSENHGALANFQFVLDEAQGEYFMWAAHDDRWAPRFLFECVKILSHNLECVTVFCGIETVDLISNSVTSRNIPTASSSDSPAFRIKIRLLDMCPSLIYGLHRINKIRHIKIEQFDWFDVYLGIFLAFLGKILIIPEFLYVAGTDGPRIPYSLTGEYISFRLFRKRASSFLNCKFVGRTRFLLLMIIYYKSIKGERYFRKIVDSRLLSVSSKLPTTEE